MYECRKIYTIDGINYEGMYEVDTCGIVYSLKSGNKKDLKPEYVKSKENYEGKVRYYSRVSLSKNNKSKKILIHNIMKVVFEDIISVVDKKEVINHKDHDGTNNNIENIEFCSKEYNDKDRNMKNAADLLMKYKDGTPVRCITTGEVFRTIHETARKLNLKPNAIWNALQPKKDGTRRTCKGYQFEYID